MKINAEVRVISPVASGISSATGSPWKRQDIVLAWPETMPDGNNVEMRVLATLHGEDIDKFAAMNIASGTVITANIIFTTRPYNGKVYNSVTMKL